MSPKLISRALKTTRRRPLFLYEQMETVVAAMAATSPNLASPVGLLKSTAAMRRWGSNPAGIIAVGAAQFPARDAIHDDAGVWTFEELERHSNALARKMLRDGIGPDSTVGLIFHNSARSITMTTAVYKTGADLVHLNTGFSPHQLREVIEREGIDALAFDERTAERIGGAHGAVHEVGPDIQRRAIEDELDEAVPVPDRVGRAVLMTSGTTGVPKGARRENNAGPLDAAAILSCIPVRAGDTTVVCAPLFHGLGLFNANLALSMGSTVILREQFDAERTLDDVERHRATVLVAVPAMLHRLLALPRKTSDKYDCSCLQIAISGGAALPGDLSTRFMDEFGDVLYNVYGSTETSLATVAPPAELRRAPGTAGHSTPGVQVEILDRDDSPAPRGTSGRIFVGSKLSFDGYTAGGDKDVVDGMVLTGDVGYVDRLGRLFVEGRDDEMIVSGGENVHPAEVEDCLAAHPGVVEAAVIGVADPEYGQRLKAFVVRSAGAKTSEKELQEHVHDRLARFKTPREVDFVESLPRTATGKVLKRKLDRAPESIERNSDEPRRQDS